MPMTRVRSRITRITGILLCVLSLVVLTGWLIGNPMMVRLAPGSVAMSINTALMFLLCAISLLLHGGARPRSLPLFALSGSVVLLSCTILVEHLFDIDLHIDLADIHDALGDGHARPGRTAPNACLGFLFASLALL